MTTRISSPEFASVLKGNLVVSHPSLRLPGGVEVPTVGSVASRSCRGHGEVRPRDLVDRGSECDGWTPQRGP